MVPNFCDGGGTGHSSVLIRSEGDGVFRNISIKGPGDGNLQRENVYTYRQEYESVLSSISFESCADFNSITMQGNRSIEVMSFRFPIARPPGNGHLDF